LITAVAEVFLKTFDGCVDKALSQIVMLLHFTSVLLQHGKLALTPDLDQVCIQLSA